jgi:hypothetical protein
MSKKNIHLIAFYVKKPRNPRMTHIKDYMADPNNYQYDERVEITRGLSGKDQTYAGIVLDLSNKKVIQNRFNTGFTDFGGLFKYFFAGYHEYIIKIMTQLDPMYLDAMLSEMQAEIESAQTTTTTEE